MFVVIVVVGSILPLLAVTRLPVARLHLEGDTTRILWRTLDEAMMITGIIEVQEIIQFKIKTGVRMSFKIAIAAMREATAIGMSAQVVEVGLMGSNKCLIAIITSMNLDPIVYAKTAKGNLILSEGALHPFKRIIMIKTEMRVATLQLQVLAILAATAGFRTMVMEEVDCPP